MSQSKQTQEQPTEPINPEDQEPRRLGDVLGLSDAPPEVEIPRATEGRSHSPADIDVRTPPAEFDELRRRKGVTGIDIRAGGPVTDVAPDPPRAVNRDE